MTPVDITLFHNCCREVIHAANAFTSNGNLQYAKEYAEKGIRMQTFAEIEAQIPYILTNLSGWRGKQAQEIKQQLRSIK